MKKYSAITCCALIFIAGSLLPASARRAKAAKTSAELEKEKALANPFANDLGPDHLDEAVLKSYPEKYHAGYKLLTQRCARCHTPSRPLNSQFVEPDGKDVDERKANAAKLIASDPDFKDKNVWQIQGDMWQRYVKRMMSKPGCEMTKEDAKKIWDFIAFDSRERKLGANKAKWAEHRKKLLAEFKIKYPARYKELYEGGAPANP